MDHLLISWSLFGKDIFRRLLLNYGHFGLELTDDAEDLLAKEGYDPAYGARPLKRTIQRMLLDPLAMEILKGGFREGDTVLVGRRNGAITFSPAAC